MFFQLISVEVEGGTGFLVLDNISEIVPAAHGCNVVMNNGRMYGFKQPPATVIEVLTKIIQKFHREIEDEKTAIETLRNAVPSSDKEIN